MTRGMIEKPSSTPVVGRRSTRAGILCLIACLCAVEAPAAVRMPAVFADHMILQAGIPLPIWGRADPGDTLTVTFADQTRTATADREGTWRVTLLPLQASRKARTLTVQSAMENRTWDLVDVLVGEVWLASGQSNMAMSLRKSAGGAEAVKNSPDPLVRVFRVAPKGVSPLKPLDDCGGEWAVAGPRTVGDVSAAGYYFLHRIRAELDVPVGLIHSAWGGTCAEYWTSREALESSPVTQPLWTQFHDAVESFDPATATPPDEARRLLDEWRKKRAQADQAGRPRPRLPKIVGSPVRKRYSPCNFYNTMIHPIVPYGIRGVLWYQGEGNRSRAEQYRTLLPVMIRDWRKRWGQKQLPFLIVRLANIGKAPDGPVESEWAELQWAQVLTARTVPDAGLAVINDGTDTSLHPRHKKPVGDRLALWALARTYGRKDVAFTGPIFREAQVRGGEVHVFFDHAAGLRSRDGKALTGFQVAGEDRTWIRADARIADGHVIVSSPSVAKPVAARYAWSGNPAGANLTNASGLPASLLKTDDWPGLSRGKRAP